MKHVLAKQLELAESLFGDSTKYARLLNRYETMYKVNLCTKHTTHDSVFYIIDEGKAGFKAIKFYNDTQDFRVGGFNASQAEAYNEAIHVL